MIKSVLLSREGKVVTDAIAQEKEYQRKVFCKIAGKRLGEIRKLLLKQAIKCRKQALTKVV